MKSTSFLTAVAALVLLNVAARAGEVKIDGVHICCGQCVNIAQKTLKDVTGVSDAKASKDSGTITLTADAVTSAAAAIDALAKAGFRGNAKHGDKVLDFPARMPTREPRPTRSRSPGSTSAARPATERPKRRSRVSTASRPSLRTRRTRPWK